MRIRAVLIALFSTFLITTQSQAADIPKKAVRPQEFCVCGYNTRTTCDGTYVHYISDCYDENNNYCGYDDQVPGDQCSGVRKFTRKHLKLHTGEQK